MAGTVMIFSGQAITVTIEEGKLIIQPEMQI